MKKSWFIYVSILSILPMEYIGMIIDYQFQNILGYIPLVIVSILLGLNIKNRKNYVLVFLIRTLGILISLFCTHIFMNLEQLASYFKPFYASGYSIFFRHS
ncbi:hypothetical protein [Staphylococcus sp.]|uniref:hypothetical protein n=1 Tax=Staphylococcus sp. TaxID=29387 RepID=UPI0025FDB93F|nr:hypothetical protein [Staphylococcus sp.]